MTLITAQYCILSALAGIGIGVYVGWFFGERYAWRQVRDQMQPQLQQILNDLEALRPEDYTGVSP